MKKLILGLVAIGISAVGYAGERDPRGPGQDRRGKVVVVKGKAATNIYEALDVEAVAKDTRKGDEILVKSAGRLKCVLNENGPKQKTACFMKGKLLRKVPKGRRGSKDRRGPKDRG